LKMKLTERGYDPRVLISLLQKAIRRNRVDLAGFAASELIRSGYANWMWRRICVTAAEDCEALVQTEINSLREACDRERKERKGAPTRVYCMKAVILLCRCYKSRDADHLSNLVVDAAAVTMPDLQAAILEAENEPAAIPDFTYDVHTLEGKRRGKTKRAFFAEEHAALTPTRSGYQPLFEELIPNKPRSES